MLGLNQATIAGNIGKIDVRLTNDGKEVVTLSLATSEKWKDKNSGQAQEKTEWHRVTLFGGPASIAAKFCEVGQPLLIVGKLTTRKWQDSEGNNRYTTEIIVDGFGGKIVLLGTPGGGKGAADSQQQSNAPQQQQQSQAPQQQQQAPIDDFNGDIPF